MTDSKRTYTKDDLSLLARRDNNEKRPWLLVNPLQGKHIPCSPKGAMLLFSDLASHLRGQYESENLLIVAFAETATAIGAAVAACLDGNTCCIPTTREIISGSDYLFFSEAHSHATEQKLVKNNLKRLLSQADRVVFAEDEVTTGNTILNAISAIEQEYSSLTLKYGVVSLLNGMAAENRATFESRKIPCTYLAPLNHENYTHRVSRFNCEPGLCFDMTNRKHQKQTDDTDTVIERTAGHYGNPRLGENSKTLLDQCRRMSETILSQLRPESLADKDVLVLGTEEFMFPPLYLGARMEQDCGCRSVRFHATSRSPILPAMDSGYPIFSRFRLRSVYDPGRTTYIYNLKKYDKVVILHDSQNETQPGLADLLAALRQAECMDISVFKWGV